MMLTRLDIEHECDLSTTGLANVGGACEKTQKCGIVEDTGPVFGITLAHEIGHLLDGEDQVVKDDLCASERRPVDQMSCDLVYKTI
ncbi:ATS10-like protein [Mya arenaria]|uniref:ATS10-like protein n=1 Tax=Mya arenaria TaxID=6604 RepID=A0ABY7DBK6_MYAAR|nr:ATS10-like protein [Mya arenaria]